MTWTDYLCDLGPSRTARTVWQKAYGPIEPGLYVCHYCDQPKCRTLEHLWLGTPTANNRDMVKKGRWIGPTGSRWTLSDATRSKMSDAALQRSPEHKARLAALAVIGVRKAGPKISAALKGRPKSEAHRRALSEALKRRAHAVASSDA